MIHVIRNLDTGKFMGDKYRFETEDLQQALQYASEKNAKLSIKRRLRTAAYFEKVGYTKHPTRFEVVPVRVVLADG